MCFVSPCERNAVERISPCDVRVGKPVDGRRAECPRSRREFPRNKPRPANSAISEMPGPEVAVMERAPAQPAPTTMPMAASSSSACTMAKVALPSGPTR